VKKGALSATYLSQRGLPCQKEERRATDEKKKRATRGKPVNTHVANTEKAKRAGKKSSCVQIV